MRIRRRHAAIFAVTAIGALAAAGAAFAITNNGSTATLKVTPNTGLSKTTFKNAALNVHTHTIFAHPGDKANGGFVKNVKLYFDSDLKFNTSAAPVCNKNLANTNEKQAMALCGSSLVGKGTAQATSTANATIPGCVLAFNAPNSKIILHSRFVIDLALPESEHQHRGQRRRDPHGNLRPGRQGRLRQGAERAERRHPAAAAEGFRHDSEQGQLRAGEVFCHPAAHADRVHLLGRRSGAGHRERDSGLQQLGTEF